MSAYVGYTCDSCGFFDSSDIKEFSQLLGDTIPKGWTITQRPDRRPRVLCIGCTHLEERRLAAAAEAEKS